MQWLAKAQVQRLRAEGTPAGNPIDVLFNPTEYTLAKSAQFAEIPIPGLDSPLLQFVRGQAETLTVDLFFDTTDAKGTGADAEPVTVKTDAFYQLIKIEAESHAPAVILFSWGGEAFPGHRTYETLAGQNRYGFKGVVESVRQRFTMFSSLGVPLRATLSLTIKEYKTLHEQIAELNRQSPDRTRMHVVAQGETITRIAEIANDRSADWRMIALHNGIANPLALEPGQVLEIPPVASMRGRQ
ncbi:LysM peptidoglycan-binding domain-containing protein [Alteraurantiacibacter aquimixticola]|uniref:LysM domain-containing protein n=1 Tax=Alteraurantiacibacter aquimixticola TaxID=2489173 RepID=A0A4T3F4K0_9SPHN|nr:LysM peptidoglycan-binding domain-containing protein [Alteraurantiacibacter aquimixticola]TIX49633.1 LysM domain-containing protein [Alteraurantiacibacter aquimixticola]